MLSVVVLTRNESRHIRSCLESARPFADELLVFDSHSNDDTADLASRAGARVAQREFDNYPAQRNAALDAAQGDWIFFLDADERVSAELAQEVTRVLLETAARADAPVLYWVPRQNYIFGKWIRHSGWYPDYQPRLLRKGRARFDPGRLVHELVLADGRESFLEQPLIHFNYETLAQFRSKQMAYTRFEAEVLFNRGVRPTAKSFVGQPAREFARRYFTLEGYKDGVHGLVLSLLMAYYALVRQRMLAAKWNAPRGATSPLVEIKKGR